MSALARLWREHRLALLIFAAAAMVTLVFALRFALFALHWSDPARRDLHPAGWMTVGYLARSWNVPREALAERLAVTPAPGRPLTLEEIAAARGEPLASYIAQVEAALTALREARPAP